MSMENEPQGTPLHEFEAWEARWFNAFHALKFVLEKPQPVRKVKGMAERQGLGALKA
jgi:hypothetical protein